MKFGAEYAPFDLTPIKKLDEILYQLATSIPVDLMPGDMDPSSTTLPQQPFNRGLFPYTKSFDSFSTVTNPYGFSIDGTSFLGSCGQNIDDVYRYSSLEERLDVAESLLTWGHMTPTAPDTLWCFPFKDTDPFILNSRPHVFFAGNQPKFESRLVQGDNGVTRIVLIPGFEESGCVCMVNMRTLDVEVVDISGGIEEDVEMDLN